MSTERKHYWEYGEQDKVTRQKYDIGDILENAARCKLCGDYIRSNNRHDYRECSCGAIAVDGGSWYAKRMGKPENLDNIIVCFEDVDGKETENQKGNKNMTNPEQPVVQATEIGGISGQKLKSFIERVERLQEEKDTISNDIKEVFLEAKGVGFDVKIMRTIIKIRKQDRDARREEEELIDLYKAALGIED